MADFSRDFQVIYDDGRGSSTIRFRCFDTPNSVTIHGGLAAGEDVESALLDMRCLCLDYHRLWSFTLEGSDICRVNEQTSRIRVDSRTAELICAMKRFHEAEESFDFTIGPLSYLWKHAVQLPSKENIASALAHIGAQKVSVEGDVVVKSDPFVKIDVGAAAKGFVADALSTVLRERGAQSAEIDLGGNLFMVGNHPAHRPWRVSVRIPAGMTAKAPVIEVCDESVVTSGSYERFVEIGGKRYQHIVDIRTGRPSESDIVSATVVAKSSLQADMLATTALLAGSRGLEGLKARHPGARFVVITEDGRIVS